MTQPPSIPRQRVGQEPDHPRPRTPAADVKRPHRLRFPSQSGPSRAGDGRVETLRDVADERRAEGRDSHPGDVPDDEA